jgi:lipopolysaccharide biosynthesis protein
MTNSKVALVAHVYYPEIWPEIATYLRKWRFPFQIYVTTTEDRLPAVQSIVRRSFPDAIVFAVPNRGRDIGPFLHVLNSLVEDGVDIFCKVHTKRSPHWGPGGNAWRYDLYNKLLGGVRPVDQITAAFSHEPGLGILAPEEHLLPNRFGWEDNAAGTLEIAARMGLTGNIVPFRFPAGTMFWARTAALIPLWKLQFTPDDFEEEGGHLNGALAHVFERIFPLAARSAGYETLDMSMIGVLERLAGPHLPGPWWSNVKLTSDPGLVRQTPHNPPGNAEHISSTLFSAVERVWPGRHADTKRWS